MTVLPNCSIGRRAFTTLGAATLFNGVAPIARAQAPTKIVFGNQGGGTLSFLLFRVALDKGYFADEGISIDFLPIGNPGVIGAALESGSIDVAVDGTSVTAANFKKGIDLRIISGMLRNIDLQLVVRRGRGIPVVGMNGATWKEVFRSFPGKTLAVPGVSSLIGLLIKALAKDVNVDPTTFTMLDTAVGAPLLAALASEQADAFMHASTSSYPAVDAGLGVIALDVSRDIPEYFENATYSAMVAHARTLEKYPGLPTKWRRALGRAMVFIDDEKYAGYLKDVSLRQVQGLAPAKNFNGIDRVIANFQRSHSFSAEVSPVELDKALSFYRRAGIIPPGVDASQLIAK